MEEIVTRGLLLDTYGALLTEKQQVVYDAAVNQDLSLSEIAENHGISRQGVSDLLNRTTKTLTEYERRLGLLQRFSRIRALCDEIDAASPDAARLTKKIRKEL